ncbi:amino acid permease-associated region [Thermoanaerobacterium xylanolyticum LX-11]|uniref:Amino acid permease-associated region n=1 Tax=Thermoanaerobacterium xylanolyticum (strain ATCC 49914 / DSM 7097 / LX-11) TaxID=858215 RepID=F6BJZ6_THEXL|nr:APC family permease [Thermoanaerobacterium xylanolyticum]AEF18017.1 amino acid permease-associated region [Thermoanaerobacterium xylanolyticum LX-11]
MEKEKILKVRDIVLMNVVAIIGLRWLPLAAKYGASSVMLWILASILFFIPQGLAVAELSTGWPYEGGLYVWAKEAFGDKYGFLTSWSYWLTNVVYYPSMLIYIASTAAYMVNPKLADNDRFVSIFIFVLFWIITLVNINGLSLSKWLSNAGGLFGTIIPGILLIGFSIYWVTGIHQKIQATYTVSSLFPNLSSLSNIVFFSSMIFAYAGLELAPTLAERTENPERTFPRAIVLSAFIIPALYILGTISITFIVPQKEIGLATGIMQAIQIIFNKIGLKYLIGVAAFLIFIGGIGGINAWIIGPINMIFTSSKGIMPQFFTKSHDKYGTPVNAMITQAIIVSLLILMAFSTPTVESAYWLLSAMTSILYFIPYLVMFSALIVLRYKKPDVKRLYKVPFGNFGAWLVGGIGFLVVLFSIILSIIPPAGMNLGSLLWYEVKLVGGTLLFLIIGFLIYRNYEKKLK